MPGYVAVYLHKYQQKIEQRQQHSPHKWERPRYGAKQQMLFEADTSLLITKKDKTSIQKPVRTLINNARAVNTTMLVALGSIVVNQSNRNEATAQSIKQLLDYCDTHPYSTIRYN